MTDISQSGCLCVVAELSPTPGETVWVRLEGPEATGWVRASATGAIRQGGMSWAGRPSYRVRLRFPGPCPNDLYKLAVNGRQLADGPRRDVAPEFADGLCR